jgi:alpha-methylacyl-CoA racemase
MPQGPLSGVKIIEFAGLGPAPFACMLLSDLGAEVLRIDRKHKHEKVVETAPKFDITSRNRKSVALDLKKPGAIETCLHLMEKADAVIEGFRPGVMERLGLGPDVVLKRNPRIVYGRMTGWGQSGPLSQAAGHDINYLAISGALAAIGPGEKPMPPLNLVGDYGGGALYLAFGVLAAIIYARGGGQGQVVDAAISDGAASLMSVMYGMYAAGIWNLDRESNLLDGGRPSYGTYECADGKWISIASSETPFDKQLRELAELDDPEFDLRADKSHWPSLHDKLKAKFRTRTRQEWVDLMEGTDVCFAPVLDMSEAPGHHHNLARHTFIEVDGVVQPAPAPRFSATPGEVRNAPPAIGADTETALSEWGVDDTALARLKLAEAI